MTPRDLLSVFRDLILEMVSFRYINAVGFLLFFVSAGLTVCYSFRLFTSIMFFAVILTQRSTLHSRVAYREAFCISFRHRITFSATVLNAALTHYDETLHEETIAYACKFRNHILCLQGCRCKLTLKQITELVNYRIVVYELLLLNYGLVKS
jgi:hypothetical protein